VPRPFLWVFGKAERVVLACDFDLKNGRKLNIVIVKKEWEMDSLVDGVMNPASALLNADTSLRKKKYKNIEEIKSETNKEINIETMMLLTHSLSLISLSLGTSLAMSPGKMTCLINRETHWKKRNARN
jgi:hypothetical protein